MASSPLTAERASAVTSPELDDALAVQELVAQELASRAIMDRRVLDFARGDAFWREGAASLWGQDWARARLTAEPPEPEPEAEPGADAPLCSPVGGLFARMADSEPDECPVCLSPPLPGEGRELECCRTVVCARCVAPLRCCPICKARVRPGRQRATEAQEEALPRSHDDNVHCAERRRTGSCDCAPITHVVIRGDSAFSIALRYRTTVDRLMRANKMAGTGTAEMMAAAELAVPVCMVPRSFQETPKSVMEEMENNAALLRFQRMVKCSRPEARFYMEDNDWSLQLALQAYAADSDWERQAQEEANPPPLPPPLPLRLNLSHVTVR